jgi:hypothetical protein
MSTCAGCVVAAAGVAAISERFRVKQAKHRIKAMFQAPQMYRSPKAV